MSYKSIIPTNAPTKGFINPSLSLKDLEKREIVHDSKKRLQATSSLIEPNIYVLRSSFINNGFLSAVHVAFQQHLPLLIIPDDIWHIFLSQISVIVNKDPETYRDTFVDHQGKEKIEIKNDDLIMDIVNPAITTEWQSVFPIFEQKMNDKMKIEINRKFSTTTLTHYIVSQILVMDNMKNYFDYSVETMCGFPEIRIGGTIEDWQNLDSIIQEICGKIFEPVGNSSSNSPNYTMFINECIKVLEENGNPDYWEKLYHFEGAKGSGQKNTITGIINDLFPVDQEAKLAPTSGNKRNVDTFPPICAKVPFVWEYLGTSNNCEFEGGLTHVGWNHKEGHVYSKPIWKINRIVN